MSPHGSLTPERWRKFTLSQQILMIGNDMNRAAKLMNVEHADTRRVTYAAILRLVDLTVDVHSSRNLRRELLRWRDLIADLYIRPECDPEAHGKAFRCLLQFTPESARQIPHVCPRE